MMDSNYLKIFIVIFRSGCSLTQDSAFALCLTLSNAQMLIPGRCTTNLTTVKNFDVNKYMGRWYEQEKFPFMDHVVSKCAHYTYRLLSNGDVELTDYQVNAVNNLVTTVTGVGKVVDSGKLIIQFESLASYSEKVNYFIIDTDYSNYSIIHYCNDLSQLFHIKQVWLLTRERNPSDDLVLKMRRILAERGFDSNILAKTNQTDCEIN